MIIRIGDGQTPSGKILDKNTHWYNYIKKYNINGKEAAIKDVIERNYQYHIYVSFGNRSYHKITFEQLKNL